MMAGLVEIRSGKREAIGRDCRFRNQKRARAIGLR